MQTVLDRADSIIYGVDGVNGLLDQTQIILDVDVNVTDISGSISVSPLPHTAQHGTWTTLRTPSSRLAARDPPSESQGALSLHFLSDRQPRQLCTRSLLPGLELPAAVSVLLIMALDRMCSA